jgi:nitrate reductase NapE component
MLSNLTPARRDEVMTFVIICTLENQVPAAVLGVYGFAVPYNFQQ